MKMGGSGHRQRFSSTVLVAVSIFAALVLMFALVLSNAVEQERLAREINAYHEEYISDPGASLNRVVFAAHRVLSVDPVPGESAAGILERKLRAAESLLSHAEYVKSIDGESLARMLGKDPLMLVPRIVASNAA